MMEKQLAGLPQKERDRVLNAVTENPEFFQNLQKEIEMEIKNGKSQMAASMEVMRKHQAELQKLLNQ